MAASKRLGLDNLVNLVSGATGETKRSVKEVINALVAEIKDKVDEDTDIRIADFGIFSLKPKAARTGRNPQTGEAVSIPAKQVLSFKPSKSSK